MKNNTDDVQHSMYIVYSITKAPLGFGITTYFY